MSETPHEFPLPEDGSIQPAAAEASQEMVFPELTHGEAVPTEVHLPQTAPAEPAPEQPAPKQKYTPAVLAMIAIGLLIALCCLMTFVVTALVLPVARAGGV